MDKQKMKTGEKVVSAVETAIGKAEFSAEEAVEKAATAVETTIGETGYIMEEAAKDDIEMKKAESGIGDDEPDDRK